MQLVLDIFRLRFRSNNNIDHTCEHLSSITVPWAHINKSIIEALRLCIYLPKPNGLGLRKYTLGADCKHLTNNIYVEFVPTMKQIDPEIKYTWYSSRCKENAEFNIMIISETASGLTCCKIAPIGCHTWPKTVTTWETGWQILWVEANRGSYQIRRC